MCAGTARATAPTRNKYWRVFSTTAHQRNLDSADVLATLLRAPATIVSPHFYPTGLDP
jgi:hypothetical protein